jgi:hypothetical protein
MSPGRRPQKYCCCPACGATRVASEFPRVTARSLGSSGFGEVRRVRCPACGHEDLRALFDEVAPPTEGEAAERIVGT